MKPKAWRGIHPSGMMAGLTRINKPADGMGRTIAEQASFRVVFPERSYSCNVWRKRCCTG